MIRSVTSKSEDKRRRNAILKAWLIAGTLDITSAFIYYYIKTGKDPVNVLSGVAGVVLGKGLSIKLVPEHENVMQVCGLLFHYMIALAWTLIFFQVFPKLKLQNKNKIVTGLVYGVCIWLVMNLVMIPLYTMNWPVFHAQSVIINTLILMVMVGLPISIIINKYYTRK